MTGSSPSSPRRLTRPSPISERDTTSTGARQPIEPLTKPTSSLTSQDFDLSLGIRSNLSKPERLQPEAIYGIDIENGTRWGWGPNGFTKSILYCVTGKWLREPDESCVSYWIDWRLPDSVLRQQLSPLFVNMGKADAFLGHNFSHDWGGLTGLARDVGLPFPAKKKFYDTMRDVPKHQGPSKSLEDMCLQFGLGDKPHLAEREWVDAFIRHNPEAIEKVIHRNRMDVILTERLYLHQIEIGWR